MSEGIPKTLGFKDGWEILAFPSCFDTAEEARAKAISLYGEQSEGIIWKLVSGEHGYDYAPLGEPGIAV